MEFRLNTFISVPDQHQGTSCDVYKLGVLALTAVHQHWRSANKTSRILLARFHALAEVIRRSLALGNQEDSLERYRDVFCLPTVGIRMSRTAGNFPIQR